MVFKPILHDEVTQLMRDASKSRVKVREHTGREVDSPHRQDGKGQFGPVGTKGLARLQELLMVEDDKSHRLIGIGDGTKLTGGHFGDTRDEPFLLFSATYDDGVCRRRCARHKEETSKDNGAEFHGTPPLVSAKLVDTRIYYNACALIQSAHFGRISLH
jgi:hypothetical protein